MTKMPGKTNSLARVVILWYRASKYSVTVIHTKRFPRSSFFFVTILVLVLPQNASPVRHHHLPWEIFS